MRFLCIFNKKAAKNSRKPNGIPTKTISKKGKNDLYCLHYAVFLKKRSFASHGNREKNVAAFLKNNFGFFHI